MESGKGYEDLRVWQRAVQLANHVYQVTKRFPADERFGLTSQIRRSAVSIPSNIAEGAARQSKREFAQFLSIASGSLAELHTQLIIARDNGLLADQDFKELMEHIRDIRRMLSGLRDSLLSTGNGQRATGDVIHA